MAESDDNIPIDVKMDKFLDKHAEIRGNLGKLLLQATREDNDEIVSALIERGADVDYSDETGWSSLHIAAKKGYSNIAHILLTKNANLDYPTTDYETPMHLAAGTGRGEIVRMLVEMGADPTCINYDDLQASDVAAANGFPDIASYLREAKQRWYNVEQENNAGNDEFENIETDWNLFVKQLDARPSEENLASPLFKLDIDCFESVFEWVSVDDLKNLRRSCKRMKQIIDFIIKRDYPGWPQQLNYKIEQEDTSFSFHEDAKIAEFHKKILRIDGIDSIGHRIQKIEFSECNMDSDIYDSILKYCVNLKYLIINNRSHGTKDLNWLLKTYPKLEHFVLRKGMYKPGTIFPMELFTFFVLNPNIRTFSTSIDFLMDNADCFERTTHKLDLLNIHDYTNMDHHRKISLLTNIYNRGFYKRLRYYDNLKADDLNRITEVASLPGIMNLSWDFFRIETVRDMEIDLPSMPHINELQFDSVNRNINWESVAEKLMNVERVYLQYETNCLVPIVLYFPKLKQIAVEYSLNRKYSYRQKIYMDENAIDVRALNEGRSKLQNACRVTIYVEDNIYMATKWTSPCMALRFVEVKRFEAYDAAANDIFY